MGGTPMPRQIHGRDARATSNQQDRFWHHNSVCRPWLGVDRFLLHRFKKSSLSFGRCPVDFICEDDVGEYRPAIETEVALFIEDLRTGDIRRHQVGCELNPLEVQIKDF
jgi:hypothetical protein